MNKYDLIKKTLAEIGPTTQENGPAFSDEPDYEEHVLSILGDKLPEGVDIKTCEDFKDLGVECCDCCHGSYAHYEMSLIDLPDGGKAWVCDHVKWAIYPEQLEKSEKFPAHEMLKKIFGTDTKE